MAYRELAPPPPLRDAIACFWVRTAPRAGATRTRVLPDACVDLIWSTGRGAWIAGPDTGPVLATAAPGTLLVGARFLPGAGGPALGVPLSELRDERVDVALLDRALAEELPADLAAREAFRRMVAVSSRMSSASPPDAHVRTAARRLADPRTRVDRLAAELGFSERQLRRRCESAVGYGPKTLQRTLRFRRFLGRAGASRQRPDLARLAAEAGYADQAHLARESIRLAGLPPSALLRSRLT